MVSTVALLYKRDVYRCTRCRGYVAFGDRYCRHCGIDFTASDTDVMHQSANKSTLFFAPTHSRHSEPFQCPDCETFVAAVDNTCRQCGLHFSDGDRFEMYGEQHDSASNAIAFLTGLLLVVLSGFVIFLLMIRGIS